ncbi:LPXTG cell wall anchor domain-containing protein [Amycolatopsis sp. NBC_01488]|uniref:LPXTG cell wall anchor domain-containing protein n=1 Tax=Amycolatopsis sp. NBC_01488 TaxID=2903563 RepID=UPI002E2E52F5|nr:LPXTG cell wall anchor domain-containing protein [Amycolatopsis sp. NBC_01488]
MRRRTFRGAVAIMALTTATLIGTAGSAFACHTDDNRATPTPKPVTCDGLKPAGDKLDKGLFTLGENTDHGKSMTITAVDKSVRSVTAIVVKGGDGWNVYVPEGPQGMRGELPWENMRSPLDGQGQRAKITDWFACGMLSVAPPTGSTAPTKPPVETTKPSAPATSDTSVAPTSTTAPAVVPAGNESGTGGGLANTGFDNSWLIWVAALLLVAGGGLLALLKFRRKASE